MTIILILINIIFTTAGQLLLKLASNKNNNIYLILGYTLFICVVFASYLLMQLIEFKYFTVIMSINYLTVMYASSIVFNETITKAKLIGTFFIIIGIIFFSFL
jgi:multidrug transporter EmrE-like cation transporter